MVGALRALHALAGGPWLALDTETTGLGPYDMVIEIALVDERGKILLESTVRPDRPIHSRASAVHGLRKDDLRGSPSWTSVWHRASPILRRAPVLAWNAAFDLRLIRQSCARHGLPFFTPRMICLREAFRDAHPIPRSTLAAACLTLGVPDRPSHRARPDAEVARKVALALMAEGTPRAPATV